MFSDGALFVDERFFVRNRGMVGDVAEDCKTTRATLFINDQIISHIIKSKIISRAFRS